MSLEHLPVSGSKAVLKTKTKTAQCLYYLDRDILNICLHKLAMNLQRQASSFKSPLISSSRAEFLIVSTIDILGPCFSGGTALHTEGSLAASLASTH